MVVNENVTEAKSQFEGDDPERNRVVEDRGPLRRSAFRALVQDFGPIWYVFSLF